MAKEAINAEREAPPAIDHKVCDGCTCILNHARAAKVAAQLDYLGTNWDQTVEELHLILHSTRALAPPRTGARV